MDVAYLETVVFFYDFQGFGGIRSTQPTELFSKIDTYSVCLDSTQKSVQRVSLTISMEQNSPKGSIT